MWWWVTQFCKFTKNHWIAYLQWIDFMACKLDVNEADCLKSWFISCSQSLDESSAFIPGENDHCRDSGLAIYSTIQRTHNIPVSQLWWAREKAHWSICQIPQGSLKRVTWGKVLTPSEAQFPHKIMWFMAPTPLSQTLSTVGVYCSFPSLIAPVFAAWLQAFPRIPVTPSVQEQGGAELQPHLLQAASLFQGNHPNSALL